MTSIEKMSNEIIHVWLLIINILLLSFLRIDVVESYVFRYFFWRRTKCAIFQKSLNRTTSCRIRNFVWLIFSFRNKYELAVFLVVIEINAWSKDEYRLPESAYTIFLESLRLRRLKFDCSESRLSWYTTCICTHTHYTHIIIIII